MSDVDFTMKQTDTDPVIFTVYDVLEFRALDLTDATTEIRVRQGRTIVALPHTVEAPPTDGQLRWVPSGELGPGPWDYQIRAVRSGVDVTAPTVGSGTFVIEAPIPAP